MMGPDQLWEKVGPRLAVLERIQDPVKNYLTLAVPRQEALVPAVRALKEDLGFEVLEMIAATDWLGPVSPEGYVRNPNPNPFVSGPPEPEFLPAKTPGFPYRPAFELSWLLSSVSDMARLFLTLEVPRSNPRVPSLSSVFRSADWQERELFDLMGIVFEGHPNLNKILTPDFLEGHPLRKDYVHIKDQYD